MLQIIRQCKKSRVQKGNILCGSYSVCITLMHVILYDKALHNFLIRLLNQNLGSVTWAKNHTEFTSTSVMFNDPNKTMHLKTTITVAELQWLFLKNMKMQSKKLTSAGGVITGRSSQEARCSSTSKNPVKVVTCSAVCPGAHAVIKWTISRCWTTSFHYFDIINSNVTSITCSFDSFKNNLVKCEITVVWQKLIRNMIPSLYPDQNAVSIQVFWRLAAQRSLIIRVFLHP